MPTYMTPVLKEVDTKKVRYYSTYQLMSQATVPAKKITFYLRLSDVCFSRLGQFAKSLTCKLAGYSAAIYVSDVCLSSLGTFLHFSIPARQKLPSRHHSAMWRRARRQRSATARGFLKRGVSQQRAGHFCGMTNPGHFPAYMPASSHGYMNPSPYWGQGQPMNQYMAPGMPASSHGNTNPSPYLVQTQPMNQYMGPGPQFTAQGQYSQQTGYVQGLLPRHLIAPGLQYMMPSQFSQQVGHAQGHAHPVNQFIRPLSPVGQDQLHATSTEGHAHPVNRFIGPLRPVGQDQLHATSTEGHGHIPFLEEQERLLNKYMEKYDRLVDVHTLVQSQVKDAFSRVRRATKQISELQKRVKALESQKQGQALKDAKLGSTLPATASADTSGAITGAEIEKQGQVLKDAKLGSTLPATASADTSGAITGAEIQSAETPAESVSRYFIP
jgi:hypothetical protein